MCFLLRALLVDLRGAGGIYAGEREGVWAYKRNGLSTNLGKDDAIGEEVMRLFAFVYMYNDCCCPD